MVSEWELEAHQLEILRRACEASDRADQALAQLADEGLTYTDRFGAPRAHPAVAVERDSRIAVARLLRELDLELGAAGEPRPPRLSRRSR